MKTRLPLLTLATLAGAAALPAQEPRPAEPDPSRRIEALEKRVEAQSYALDQLQKAIAAKKKDLLNLRRIIGPQRDVLAQLPAAGPDP